MKKRFIKGVELNINEEVGVWVHIRYQGKPELLSDGSEVYNRYYRTYKPERYQTYIRRARLMQDMIAARMQ